MKMIHEGHQNDVLVLDNMSKHRNLDRFVNYLNVLIAKPNKRIFWNFIRIKTRNVLVLDIE